MKFDKVLIIAIIISLLFHIFLLLPLVQKEEKKAEAEQPIEVEILPKKEKAPPPPIPVEPPPPVDENIAEKDDDRDTTLENDAKSSPKAKGAPKIIEKAPEEGKEEAKVELPKVEDKNYDILDTHEITERIANLTKQEAEGEDTASYNSFEQRYASYFSKLRRQIYQVWTYPQSSLMRGESGVVVTSFSILRDGSIVNIKILQSSGYPALDKEVMRTLKTLGKTPLPSSYKLEQLNISEATFIYTIGGGVNRYFR